MSSTGVCFSSTLIQQWRTLRIRRPPSSTLSLFYLYSSPHSQQMTIPQSSPGSSGICRSIPPILTLITTKLPISSSPRLNPSLSIPKSSSSSRESQLLSSNGPALTLICHLFYSTPTPTLFRLSIISGLTLRSMPMSMTAVISTPGGLRT